MIYRSIYQFKPLKDRCLNPLAKWLMQNKITANQITVIGLLFGLLATVLFIMKLFYLGTIALFLSVFADLLDGTLARISQNTDGIGKYVDAVSDRLVEVGWVVALVLTNKMPWWACFLPVSSILLLFARMKAYYSGIDTSFVLVTRFERTTIIIGALFIPWVILANIFLLLVISGTFLSGISIINVLWQHQRLKNNRSEVLKNTPLSKPQIMERTVL